MKTKAIIQYSLTVVFGVAAFLFWWLQHPELISFHEQNQLFLFSHEYFAERISVAGGMADYISEFLTQFYYYIAPGAVIVALSLVLLQVLFHAALRHQLRSWEWTAYLLSFVPAILMWVHLLDENALLSYPIALILSLGCYLLCRRWGWVFQLAASLPLYWLVGPAFVVQVALSIIDRWRKKTWRRALIDSSALAIVAVSWFYACRTLWMAQYPWDTVLAGINYHRLSIMTLTAPDSQYGIIYTMLALLLVTLLLQWTQRRGWFRMSHPEWISVVLMVAASALAINDKPHDANVHALLEQAYLMRKGDWQGIIQKAEEYNKQQLPALQTPLSGNAVNLSLALTNQLAARMFEFPQAGIQGLVMPNVRDNVSNVASMEVFWHLGMINEALRYAFDSQESIANCRKSGRFMRRMAECNIINGRYDVASKYIDLLKQSLFYSQWAETAETYLYDEAKIDTNPEWAQRRQLRYKEDFLYFYPELAKMLGKLYLDNRSNKLAYDYFMASLLLEGNAQSFVANLPQQPERGQDPFPKGYRKYIEYMQAHANNDVDVTSGATSNR